MAIGSFKDKPTEAVSRGAIPRGFSAEVVRAARRKFAMLVAADRIGDLASPPGNTSSGALRGARAGQYSIRINEQWRICFRWVESRAEGSRSSIITRRETVLSVFDLRCIRVKSRARNICCRLGKSSGYALGSALGVPRTRIERLAAKKDQRYTPDDGDPARAVFSTSPDFWMILKQLRPDNGGGSGRRSSDKRDPTAPLRRGIVGKGCA